MEESFIISRKRWDIFIKDFNLLLSIQVSKLVLPYVLDLMKITKSSILISLIVFVTTIRIANLSTKNLSQF